MAYLSQVDVNSILQELWGLPGPLLNGQHPDCFHTGLQLDHSRILILREIRGGAGGGSVLMENELAMRGRLDFCNPQHNQKECFFINIRPPSSVTADVGRRTSVITGLPCFPGIPRLCSVLASTKNLIFCCWGCMPHASECIFYLAVPQLPSTSTLIVSLLKFN